MRADARRNRQRLVESARAELALAVEDARGSGGRAAGLSLDAVARRAQVGPGTLYRHFPSRQSLIQAVYQEELHQLCAAADTLLREGLGPDVALTAWMSKYADFVATKRGMSEVLREVKGPTASVSPTPGPSWPRPSAP